MKKILIVEDNRLDRKILLNTLKNAFGQMVSIEEAQDGIIALELLAQKDFQLVITDLIMPNMEGMELIQKIKSNYPSVENIIAISGSNPYYLYLAKKMGVHGVYTKPIDLERFLDTVKSMLNIESMLEKINLC
jgi:CheY-like chemotaxis protein